MSAGYEMRVSDAEREAAAGELREHFASGRLTQDELDQRLTAVFAARTRGDLNALFTDLPSSGRSGPFAASGPDSWPGQWQGQGWGSGGYGPGGNQSWGRGRRPMAGLGVLAGLIPVLVIFGALWAFGIGGGGRPLGIVLLLAAFALLRRLLFVIFGRRRGRGGRGGRGGGPRRRRRY